MYCECADTHSCTDIVVTCCQTYDYSNMGRRDPEMIFWTKHRGLGMHMYDNFII